MTKVRRLRKKIAVDDTLLNGFNDALGGLDNAGDGTIQTVPVSDVELNIDNPRKLYKVSPEEIRQHVSGKVDLTEKLEAEGDRKRLKFWEGIQNLASSIQQDKLIHPVVIRRKRQGYRLISGERRFLAHLASDLKTIRATVRPESSEGIEDELRERATALNENMLREDLTLGEQVAEIKKIVELYEDIHGEDMSPLQLKKIIHKDRATCSRMLKLIRGPQDVLQATLNNEISNLIKIGRIIDIGDQAKRNKALRSASRQDLSDLEDLEEYPIDKKPAASPRLTPNERSNSATPINLGVLDYGKRPLVQRIVERVLPDFSRNQDIDWDDAKAIQKLWRDFIIALEKEVEK